MTDQQKQNRKSKEEFVWFTDDVLWNNVMGKDKYMILSPQEFIKRAEKKYKVVRWRIIPEYKCESR